MLYKIGLIVGTGELEVKADDDPGNGNDTGESKVGTCKAGSVD